DLSSQLRKRGIAVVHGHGGLAPGGGQALLLLYHFQSLCIGFGPALKRLPRHQQRHAQDQQRDGRQQPTQDAASSPDLEPLDGTIHPAHATASSRSMHADGLPLAWDVAWPSNGGGQCAGCSQRSCPSPGYSRRLRRHQTSTLSSPLPACDTHSTSAIRPSSRWMPVIPSSSAKQSRPGPSGICGPTRVAVATAVASERRTPSPAAARASAAPASSCRG